MTGRTKLVFMGVLTAAALALSFLEGLLPSFAILPGAKLGLANVVTVLALYLLPETRDAFLVVLARVLLGGFFAGGGAIFYSFAGAVASFFVMWLIKGAGRFSLPVVSLAGGIVHNAAQLALAAVVLESPALAAYLPLYAVAGLLAGLAVGLAAAACLKPVRQALQLTCR